MKKTSVFIIIILFCSSAVKAEVSSKELAKQMKLIVDKLTKQYHERGGTRKTLAILPPDAVSASGPKKEARVFADFLTHEFVRQNNFSVVEREDLMKILDEQKLQQSGATDAEKAVKIGKLLGAGLLTFGHLEYVGDKLILNERLVDAEKGDVVAAAYGEYKADLFVAAAAPASSGSSSHGSYPEINIGNPESLAWYFSYERFKATEEFPAFTLPDGSVFTPKPFSLNMWGTGLQIFPKKFYFLDFGAALSMGSGSAGTVTETLPYTDMTLDSDADVGMGYSLKASAGLRAQLIRFVEGSAAAGINYLSVPISDPLHFDQTVSKAAPFVRADLAFRPSESFSMGCRVNRLLSTVEGSSNGHLFMRLEPTSFEPYLNFYYVF